MAVDLRGASRILVFGVTGSGKSTLAARISSVTGTPWYSVDDLTWAPGWTEVPLAEQRRRIESICARETWILDAAYGKWLDIPLGRVEVIVGLDYPRWRSLGRLSRRTVTRLIAGRSICNGNRESLRHTFSKESILVWHFRSFDRQRQRIRSWEADPAGPPVLRISSPGEIRKLLAALPAGDQSTTHGRGIDTQL